MNKNEIKVFNKLNKERKSLYWKIHNISDEKRETRVFLRKKFMELKQIFMKYKTDKNLISEKSNKLLESYLNKFKQMLKDKGIE